MATDNTDVLKLLSEQFDKYAELTLEARTESERDQDYDNHQQWTDEEVAELDARNQAPVVINRIKPKVNVLTGMQKVSRTKPKALPRTPKHTDAADAITEGLRFVVDNNDFSVISSATFRNEIVCGYGAAIVEFDDNKDIAITKIPWDRYYFDPHSRELDFSDKSFDGIITWMEKTDAIEQWPDKEEEIRNAFSAQPDRTFEDKPFWINESRTRIQILQHFYKDKGTWKTAIFSAHFWLEEPADSPWLNEDKKPSNPIEAQTAYIDRELQRYGEVRGYIWGQDETNHRRSKLLYNVSVNQTIGEDGAVDNIDEMKREAAKSDGHIKTNKGFEFQFRDRAEENQVQFALYQEAKKEIDEVGANSALAGRAVTSSGRQDQIQQAAGKVELASLYDGHKMWEQRIYRQIWNRIKQSWTAEKWVRVTDDKSNLQWVGFNLEITVADKLQEAIEQGDQDAAGVLQQLTLQGDPRLQEVVEVRNSPAEIDVDILIVEAPDFTILQQETFEKLADIAERTAAQGDSQIFPLLIELSDIHNKDEILKKLEPDPIQQQAQVELASQAAEVQLETEKAKLQKLQAEAEKIAADAEAQLIENELVKAGFDIPDREATTREKQAKAVLREEEALQKRVETEALLKDPKVEAVAHT